MESGYPQSSINGKRSQWLLSLGNVNDSQDVLKLGDIFASLGRRSWLIAGSTIGCAAVGALLGRAYPIYEGQFQILTKPVTVENRVVSSLPQALDAQSPQRTTADATSRVLDETKLKLLYTEKVLQPVVEKLQPQYPQIDFQTVLAGLEIKQVPGTDILQVSYSGSDPEVVRDVLQELGTGYVAYSLEERQTDVKQGIKFLDNQLPQLEARVSELQGRLQSFRQQNVLFDPESQSREISDQLTAVRRERIDNQVQLDQTKARYQELRAENTVSRGDRKVALALTESSRYQNLLQELATLDNQIAAASAIYQSDHPEVKILQDQRAKMLPFLEMEARRVQAEAASQVQNLAARNAALLQKEAELTGRVQGLAQSARQYTEIQRELEIATANLNQFLAKRSALAIEVSQRQTPWQLLSPSKGKPKLVSLGQNLLLGGVVGLALGTGAALMMDKWKNVFHATEELKKVAGVPLLGVLPSNHDLGSMQPNSLSQATFAANAARKFGMGPFLESVRSLKTNLRLLNADAPIHSIVISSAMPQDGKSTIAAYLAQVAAAMGQRVLLVDAEMRRPQLHNRLGIQNTRGLSDLLVSNASPSEYIVQAPLSETMFILTAGHLPPDPVSLLASKRMQQLMDFFAGEFDLVIYDTPPLAGFSDAHLVASKADGLLLVARMGETNCAVFEQVVEGLRMLPTKVLGVIANDAKHALAYGVYNSYYHFQTPSQAQPLAPGKA
jgi:capsular exopolysaccharide synthesis family protein